MVLSLKWKPSGSMRILDPACLPSSQEALQGNWNCGMFIVVVVRLGLVLVLSLALLVDLLLTLRGVLRLGEVQVCSTGSSCRSLWIRLAC